MDHFCCLCFVFPFIAALWSPAEREAGLLALLCVMFSCVLVTFLCGVQVHCVDF